MVEGELGIKHCAHDDCDLLKTGDHLGSPDAMTTPWWTVALLLSSARLCQSTSPLAEEPAVLPEAVAYADPSLLHCAQRCPLGSFCH